MKQGQIPDLGPADARGRGRTYRAPPRRVVWIEMVATVVELTSPIVTAALATLVFYKLVYTVLTVHL